ncbi:restriction endonuclease subunit S [Aeromonas veronii]|uniref:restriction endonuclease subunit S n=1 Tax=Aeromonas veronii TaxID=654 RepID=UPI003BA0C850
MKWPMEKLGIVAPAKPMKSPKIADSNSVWLLNLDMVESHTGRVIDKLFCSTDEAGTSTHWFDENYVLYSKLRPYLNKVVVPDELGLATTELVPMLPDPERLDRNYLAYYLRSEQFVRWVNEQVAGAKMPRVSMKIFWEHEIPLPPLEEQKRIVTILDKADAIRQKRQQAIALADDFLRSVFLDMFGDPVTNPLGWKTGSLIDFGDFKNGLNYTSSEVGEEVFCIGVGDFKSLDRIEGVSSLSKINLSSLPKNDYFVDEGDILFVRSNGNKELVGRNVIVYPEGSKVTFSGFCIRYRINDKDSLSNLYLSHCLKIPSMRKLLLSGGQGANIQNISQKTLSELIIPIPSIDMQNTYNEIVNGHQRLIKKSNYDFLKSYELFNSISKKAFSGQL